MTGIIMDPVAWDLWSFITVAIVVFGIAMIALGFFSAYFGKGKNRNYGLLVAVVGAVVLIAWLWLTIWSGIEPYCCVEVWDTILNTLIALIAVIIGVAVAAGIFLVTVLKS